MCSIETSGELDSAVKYPRHRERLPRSTAKSSSGTAMRQRSWRCRLCRVICKGVAYRQLGNALGEWITRFQ
jgi:hypothetical protein